MTYAVEVQNLSKSIDGCPILKNICMRVKQGEIYGFLRCTISYAPTVERYVC